MHSAHLHVSATHVAFRDMNLLEDSQIKLYNITICLFGQNMTILNHTLSYVLETFSWQKYVTFSILCPNIFQILQL